MQVMRPRKMWLRCFDKSFYACMKIISSAIIISLMPGMFIIGCLGLIFVCIVNIGEFLELV